MNYRHAFHAGNFADVVKHATLALVIEHLKQKPAAFRVIDTHAGAGIYDLAGDESGRTGEWQGGIGRLVGEGAAPLPDDVAEVLKPYLAAVAACRGRTPDGQKLYPGSPQLALALMRDADRLIANELHPEDAEHLSRLLARDKRAKVLQLDGWQMLKATLPPVERRGVVLIDPPFEEAGEFQRLAQGLKAAAQRFATGVYILWFPIKDAATVAPFQRALQTLALPKLLWVEFQVATPDVEAKLSATGLAILNPPFRLDSQLETLLQFLVERLENGPGARARMTWLSGEQT